MFDHSSHLQNNMFTGMMNPMGMAGQMQMTGMPMEPQLRDISVPGVNDVMCGRGGGTNNHIGNIRFRQLVNGHKLRYLAATKSEKPMVSREVVTIWRGLQPPGRFLMQEKGQSGNTGRWYDIGDKKAREKASQCLRERTPEVMPFVKKLELQLKLQQEEDGGLALIQKSDEHGNQTAAELSKELLQEQQQAAITAHMTLQAYLPPSILKMSPDIQQSLPMQPTSNGNIGVGGHPVHRPQMHHSGGPPQAHMGMMSHARPDAPLRSNPNAFNRKTASQEQMNKLAKEIEMLQQEQAKLEEMAKMESARQAGLGSKQSSSRSSTDILTGLGLDPEKALNTLEPLHPYDQSNGAAPLTKEEYRSSVRVFLGTSSGASSGNRSVASNNKNNLLKSEDQDRDIKVRTDSFDRSDYMETMSRSSWMKSVNTFDDVSMTSNVMLSPGSSVKQMMLNDIKPLDIEPLDIRNNSLLHDNMNMKKSDKSLGKASLSTFESQILENLISPTNDNTLQMGASMPALPNIDEDDSRILPQNRMPPPTSRYRGGYAFSNYNSAQTHAQQQSNSSMTAPVQGQQPTYGGSSRSMMNANMRGASAVSMLSDLSDFSNKSAIHKQKMEALSKMRSDASVYNDNMSDLSEAMGSLDMSTTK